MKQHFSENYPAYIFSIILLFCFYQSIKLISGQKKDKWKQPPGDDLDDLTGDDFINQW